MEKLFKYLKQYIPLSDSAKEYLENKGRVLTFKKGENYILQQQSKHNWCFLLEGLVIFHSIDSKGKETIEKFCPVNHYFVGTKHIFSKSPQRPAIQFIQPSSIYTISNQDLKKGIKQYKELYEFYNILKQHEINYSQIFLGITRTPREERLAYLEEHFPGIRMQMTVRQICSLLGYTDDRQYYKALDYFYTIKR